MFATALALIGQEFEGHERAKAIAAWGATVGLASAVGPLLGGSVTDVVGWRWIFFLNIPIGIVTIVLALRTANVRDPEAKRLDWTGLVTFSGSLLLLMLGLTRGNDMGWSSTSTVSLLIGSLALMIAFVAVERRQPRPMLDLSLFHRPAFVGVSAATLAIGAGLFAALPFLTLYLQNGLGYSPLKGGLCLLPGTVMSFIVPLATRAWTEKLPAGIVLAAALATTAAGLIAMHGLTVESTWTALVPGLLLAGTGVGFANPAIARIALGVVPPQRAGMASGISNTFRVGGIAVGIAALGAVFEHHLTASPTHTGLVAASHEAIVSSTNLVLTIGAVLVLLGAIAALTLVRSRHFHTAAAPAHQPSNDPAPQPTAA
jgi:predicted MFS family arabinose efflux permease